MKYDKFLSQNVLQSFKSFCNFIDDNEGKDISIEYSHNLSDIEDIELHRALLSYCINKYRKVIELKDGKLIFYNGIIDNVIRNRMLMYIHSNASKGKRMFQIPISNITGLDYWYHVCECLRLYNKKEIYLHPLDSYLISNTEDSKSCTIS